jgi:hypothetical protein
MASKAKTLKKAAAKKIAAPKKVVAKKAASKKAIVKKAAAKKAAAKKAAPKKAAPKKAASKKAASKKAAPKKPRGKTGNKGEITSFLSDFAAATTSRHIIPVMDSMTMNDNFNTANAAKDFSNITFFDGREFDIDLFQILLSQPGIEKIRFRNAVNANNEHTLTITGVNENGYDIYLPLNNSAANSDGGEGAGDMGDQCIGGIY